MEQFKREKRQLLHWVFKIGNLKKNLDFFKNGLKLEIQRHEEFQSGCEAQCNGAYSRPWVSIGFNLGDTDKDKEFTKGFICKKSKTMIGNGDEKTNFVFELTFNYGVKQYERGNDLRCIDLLASTVDFDQIDPANTIINSEDGHEVTLISPDGYHFRVFSERHIKGVQSPVLGVVLNVSNLERSLS